MPPNPYNPEQPPQGGGFNPNAWWGVQPQQEPNFQQSAAALPNPYAPPEYYPQPIRFLPPGTVPPVGGGQQFQQQPGYVPPPPIVPPPGQQPSQAPAGGNQQGNGGQRRQLQYRNQGGGIQYDILPEGTPRPDLRFEDDNVGNNGFGVAGEMPPPEDAMKQILAAEQTAQETANKQAIDTMTTTTTRWWGGAMNTVGSENARHAVEVQKNQGKTRLGLAIGAFALAVLLIVGGWVKNKNNVDTATRAALASARATEISAQYEAEIANSQRVEVTPDSVEINGDAVKLATAPANAGGGGGANGGGNAPVVEILEQAGINRVNAINAQGDADARRIAAQENADTILLQNYVNAELADTTHFKWVNGQYAPTDLFNTLSQNGQILFKGKKVSLVGTPRVENGVIIAQFRIGDGSGATIVTAEINQ